MLLNAPSMSWVRSVGRGGVFPPTRGLEMCLIIGSMVRNSASMAELLYWAPIWVFEMAPHLLAAVAIRFATMVSRILPKHDWRDMGR